VDVYFDGIENFVEHVSILFSAISVVFVMINFIIYKKHNRESDYIKIKQDATTNLIKMVEIHHQIVYRMWEKSDKDNNGLSYLHKLLDEYEKKLERSKINEIKTDRWKDVLQKIYDDFLQLIKISWDNILDMCIMCSN